MAISPAHNDRIFVKSIKKRAKYVQESMHVIYVATQRVTADRPQELQRAPGFLRQNMVKICTPSVPLAHLTTSADAIAKGTRCMSQTSPDQQFRYVTAILSERGERG